MISVVGLGRADTRVTLSYQHTHVSHPCYSLAGILEWLAPPASTRICATMKCAHVLYSREKCVRGSPWDAGMLRTRATCRGSKPTCPPCATPGAPWKTILMSTNRRRQTRSSKRFWKIVMFRTCSKIDSTVALAEHSMRVRS